MKYKLAQRGEKIYVFRQQDKKSPYHKVAIISEDFRLYFLGSCSYERSIEIENFLEASGVPYR
jgi:hypothetical protein